MRKILIIMASISLMLSTSIILTSCGSNEAKEFSQIERNDLKGYEDFLAKYPNGEYAKDAQERIEVIKANNLEAREAIRNQRLVDEYGNNSLRAGDQPYARWYGRNKYYDDYTPHSSIEVTAPNNSDVIVIVRYGNANGNVAGHMYLTSGSKGTIQLKNGQEYQTFFYYGKGWCPDKEMKNGILGGFVSDEAFSKDGSPTFLSNQVLTYKLVPAVGGNFDTTLSEENEIF